MAKKKKQPRIQMVQKPKINRVKHTDLVRSRGGDQEANRINKILKS